MQKTPISKEGWEALRTELNFLLDVERPRVVDEVAFAAAQGDRSENAEYIYGKRKLREIDRRIRFVSKRIDSVVVVEGPPPGQGEIRFGARVELRQDSGKTMTVRIVGEDEIDPSSGRISLKSPIGKALIGRKAGERIQVPTPRGAVVWIVSALDYGE